MEKIDKLLILISMMIILAGGSYLVLVPDVANLEGHGNSPIVATVTYKEKTVKYKPAYGISWSNSFINQALYENDQLYTYENSIAQIEYENGLKLNIKPNTLIRILPYDENNDFLDLIKGDIDLSVDKNFKAKDLSLSIKGKTYKVKVLKESTLKISEINGEGKLDVVKGTVDLIKENQKVRLKGGEKVVAGDGIKKARIDVLIKAPLYEEKIILKGTNEINFKWKLETNMRILKSKFILAQDDDFKSIVFEKEVATEELIYRPEKIIPGKYFWKISYQTESDQIDSSIFPFQLVAFVTPTPLRPENEEVIYIDKGKAYTSAKFEWSESGYDEIKYKIEIVDNENEKVESETLQPYYDYVNLKEGVYRWRVKSTHPNFGQTDWSEIKSLNVNKQVEISALDPQNKSRLTISKPNEAITFKWNKIKNYQGQYKIKISRDNPNFQGEVIEKSTSRNSFSLPFSNEGVYYWYIDAGKAGLSQINVFGLKKVPLPGPLNIPRRTVLKSKNNRYYIDWKGSDLASAYIIEIYRDKYLNKKIVGQKIFNSNYTWEGKRAGSYYYRVQIIDHWGRSSRFSKLGMLVIQ